jgi:hypothetical protein
MGHHQKRGQTPKVSKLKKEKNLSAYDQLTDKEKIIFLSGIFDGEGSFGVWSRGKGRPKTLQIKVETCDSDMVARFHEMFGGVFHLTGKRQEHHKNLFRWRMTGDGAWIVLQEMIPYMCLRRRRKYNGLVKPFGYGCEDWGSHLQKQTRNEEINVRRSNENGRAYGQRTDRVPG